MKFKPLVFVVIAAITLQVGCGFFEKPGKLIVVFVDLSASVRDVRPYREDWQRILRGLQPGDRVIVGVITDKTYTEFRPIVDQEIPRFNWFKDNSLTYQARVDAIRTQLSGGIDPLFSTKRTSRTAILDSFDLAAKIFHSDSRQPILVILSDMLEDSEVAGFERHPASVRLARQLVGQRKAHHSLPDLGGAEVYVAGASASTSSAAHEIERFWVEYIGDVHGHLSSDHYASALIGFSD